MLSGSPERRSLTVTRFASAQEFRDVFAASYGPVIAAYRNVADDPERIAALDAALIELADTWGAGTGSMQWEYLFVRGVVA